MRENHIHRLRGGFHKTAALAVAALSLAAMPVMTSAAILAADDFESSTLGTLQGQTSGSNWAGAWDVVDVSDSQVNVIAAALDYAGGSVQVDGGAQAVQYDGTSNLDPVVANREMNPATGTVYYSFLYRTANLSSNEFFQLGLDNNGDNPNISVVDNVPDSGRQLTIRNGTGGGVDSGVNIVNEQTYFVVVKTTKGTNYNNTTLYVNPTNITEGYNTSVTTNSDSGISLDTSAFVALRSARLNSGDTFIFDQLRVGTSFADVIDRADPIYSADFAGVSGTQPTGFAAYTDPGMVSNNDGSSEYQQKYNTAGGVAVASLADTTLIDRGSFRDVTAETLTRYSGGSGNLNGLILRSRGITDTASGDYYHVRVEGDNLVLYRSNNGTLTQLATVATSSLANPTDRLLRVTVENESDAGTDNVRIRARLYTGSSDANSVAGELDFLDTDASAITRAGGVGFRSNNSASGSRATFDSLRVYNQSTNLLFYDDYYDNQAVRMTGYNDTGMSQSVADQTYTFTSTTSSGVQKGIATIDFDSYTAGQEWADVAVTTVMNTTADMVGGLVLRETSVSDSGDGSWYTFRLDTSNDLIQIGRQNPSFAVLDEFDLGESIPLNVDIYLLFSAINVDGDVLLHGIASLNADFSNPFADMTYLDTNSAKILGPGSAGMRVFSRSIEGTVTFDNFTVTAIPEPSTFGLLALAGAAMIRRRRA
ncbi:PEP-CTERM sorting domain-containing protein [Planctomycetales bacterium ZRK34]|nr:PEP-CTERM sorting domain-containing protein [Planctomycetales bacterium ZRK34]